MSRTLIVFAVLMGAGAFAPVSAGPGAAPARKPRLDESKARALVETLKGDPDEKKRKAAADELGAADSRVSPDVAPALVRALRTDISAAVRAEAAASLRELGEVFAQAAVALEEAAESDSSPLVRLAAKRTLWDYYLNGYRFAKDEVLAQTAEPPIASPRGPQQAVALVPAPAAPAVAPRVPPVVAAPGPQLPQVASQPIPAPPAGPRMFLPNVLPGARAAVRSMFTPAAPTPPAPAAVAPPVANLTGEPPVAKKSAPPAPVAPLPRTPDAQPEPPPVPDYVPTLPPFRPDLPSVVTPPWATPLPVPKLAPIPK